MLWLLEARDFDQLYEAVVAAGRDVERHAECFSWTDEFGAWDVGPGLTGMEVQVRRYVYMPDTNEVWKFETLLDSGICRDPNHFVSETLPYMAARTPEN